MRERETTRYSRRETGDAGNWHQDVRFDVTEGYLGITQWKDDGKGDARVLLTPKQLKALTAFVSGRKAHD